MVKLFNSGKSLVQKLQKNVIIKHQKQQSYYALEKKIKNELLDEVISTFAIKRSLSMKGCPYDNAVAEATFKIFKTEFVYGRNFDSLAQLRYELAGYVQCFNTGRIHGVLNYLTPSEFRKVAL